MKKYKNILILIIIISSLIPIVFATVTTANIRKTLKLPWNGTATGYYDSAHNVGTSYLADDRFTCVSGICSSNLSNTGVVLDNITSLYWQSGGPSIVYNRDDANSYCNSLDLGGFTDWRMPNIKELRSIVDYSTFNPAINTTLFGVSTLSLKIYWTSTLDGVSVRLLEFIHGYSNQATGKNSTDNIRCVRY